MNPIKSMGSVSSQIHDHENTQRTYNYFLDDTGKKLM